MLPEDVIVGSAAQPVLLGVAQGRADPLVVQVRTGPTTPHLKPAMPTHSGEREKEETKKATPKKLRKPGISSLGEKGGIWLRVSNRGSVRSIVGPSQTSHGKPGAAWAQWQEKVPIPGWVIPDPLRYPIQAGGSNAAAPWGHFQPHQEANLPQLPTPSAQQGQRDQPVVEGCAVGPPPAVILLLSQPKPMVSFPFIAFNEGL